MKAHTSQLALPILIALATLTWPSFVISHADEEVDVDVDVDFPPMLDADDISFFSSNYDIDGLHWALSNVFQRSKRNTNEREIIYKELPQILASRGGGDTYTTQYKLEMDLEQAVYLVNNHLLSQEEEIYFAQHVIPTYEKVLGNIPSLGELSKTEGLYAFRKEDYDLGIGSIYNKALHLTDFDVLKDGDGNLLPLLNDGFDAHAIEEHWFGTDDGTSNSNSNSNINNSISKGIVVIDDILSPKALQRIRALLNESTVFYQTKMPLKFGGYVGAYIDDGLHDKILLQLAFELNKALPNIMNGHPLKYLWAYKYDSRYTGINTHADQAAINVNLWIAPEDANLNKDSGGLVVFTAKPPADWDFEKYNMDTTKVMKEILEPTNFANVTVPYRENRAVIFDSALFHHTDEFTFKEGYANRRINLTILYGDMVMGSDDNGGRSTTSSEL